VKEFWAQDESLTFLLAAVVLMVFFIQPLVDVGWLAKFTMAISGSLILAAGMLVVGSRPILTVIGAILAVLTFLIDVAHLVAPAPWLLASRSVCFILFLGLLNSILMNRVMRDGPVNRHRIQGAILVYLILGLMWSQGYQFLEALSPGSFSIPDPVPGSEDLALKLNYFSFATLTTVGYGDITALHPFARCLAILEALTGQLFPTILIARLVALQVDSSNRNRPSPKD
ncbi:MAG: potassium channel family protein, partial [Acidobacteria bacterium]|nr:potassium channel family protein [Acidobacteriota bacterium]